MHCLFAKSSNCFVTLWTVACQFPLSVGFPRKNTGMGCHFLLQVTFLTQRLNLRLLHQQVDSLPLSHQGSPICMHKNKVGCSVVSCSLRPHGLLSTRLLCPWDLPGRNTGVGCHFLLQETFPTQGLNLPLLQLQADSFPLSHLGSSGGPYLNLFHIFQSFVVCT